MFEKPAPTVAGPVQNKTLKMVAHTTGPRGKKEKKKKPIQIYACDLSLIGRNDWTKTAQESEQ